MNFFDFYNGKCYHAYQYLGAHPENGGVTFRTYAPRATRVALIGEWNQWEERPMHRTQDGRFWECFVPSAAPGQMYKYRIYAPKPVDHCDPYGFGMELRPNSASVVRDLGKFQFDDADWMNRRTDCKCAPLNIYEIHFGSFRKPSEKTDDWYRYEELGEILIPYLVENGYTHVEIMPIGEYPCDESWGYQSTGFFSPTSRYGTADGLRAFVNDCHRAGIGVLLDFVPVHFAVDEYGLVNYDGSPLYEYPNDAVGVSEWGSHNFVHSRGEVASFLESAANYWLTEYHIDGLRMDAISRILYWQGDTARGVNTCAVSFLREMNAGLKSLHPTVILAAEDSTSFPGVTCPVACGGLGFDYKWDMGWMNDTLDYFRTAPEYRPTNYHKLTFSMMYYYSENFLLPLSHDEVVHGKATILQKMNGQYEDKFPQARAMYLYMYTHPGKKLNFMGNEFGQLREWDEKREQDWQILTYPAHDAFRRYMKDLCHLYLNHPALYADDYSLNGFEWLDCHEEPISVYAFIRRGGNEQILTVFNFSDQKQIYRHTVPDTAKLTLLLDSDRDIYSGSTPSPTPCLLPEKGNFTFSLPRFSAVCYLMEPIKKEK